MREAAHGIATVLLLTGCLGLAWMTAHACQALAHAITGGSALSEAAAHPKPIQTPFVLAPN